eukprot:COSAG02_NODE_88_length_38629_cov_457.967999_3_plen_85_part_00
MKADAGSMPCPGIATQLLTASQRVAKIVTGLGWAVAIVCAAVETVSPCVDPDQQEPGVVVTDESLYARSRWAMHRSSGLLALST